MTFNSTPNRNRQDSNKFGFKLGDILHVSMSFTANSYGHGGTPTEIPRCAKARIVGIKQTTLNAELTNSVGDVSLDVEMVDYTNEDGTPVQCGNYHAGRFIEADRWFALCPDGSGQPGRLWPEGAYRWAGCWTSLEMDSPDSLTPATIMTKHDLAIIANANA